MKKLLFYFALMCAVNLLLINNNLYAQQEERHFFEVQTFKTVIPEDGSYAERDSLMLEWVKAVQNKNDKFISVRHLRHYYGSDSRDWVVIWEYKSWEDIEAASNKSVELFREHWPDDKERAEFNKKFGKYWTGHSDEIYREFPKFRK